jgi:Na+-translocating ferredoxin:NAD+ oxidoreductase RnfC subunit
LFHIETPKQFIFNCIESLICEKVVCVLTINKQQNKILLFTLFFI